MEITFSEMFLTNSQPIPNRVIFNKYISNILAILVICYFREKSSTRKLDDSRQNIEVLSKEYDILRQGNII